MRLADHLSKAAWSMADRFVFLSYGLVGIAQIAVLPQDQWGVFFFFNEIYEILFTLSDGFVLQALVKFGVDDKRSREVMAATFLVHTIFIGTLSVGAFLLRSWLAHGFHEAKYLEVLTALPILCLLTIPRTYALKLFQMLIRTREIFLINLAFFSTMGVVTAYRISTHTLMTAESMIEINMTGAIAGSLMGFVLAIPHVRFRWPSQAAMWRDMLPFGFFQGLATTSNVMQQRADGFMVQYFLSTSILADYGTAKRFFKVFDAARDAVGTIAYPAVARLTAQQRFAELKTLIEKMMSFTLIGMTPIVLFCELGGTALMFHTFFGHKYDTSIPIFNILAFVGLLLPFTLNLTVLTGLGKSRTIFKVVLASSVVSLLSNYFLVQSFNAPGAAFAVVIAALVSGALATMAVNAEVTIEYSSLLRGIGDGWRYFRKRLS